MNTVRRKVCVAGAGEGAEQIACTLERVGYAAKLEPGGLRRVSGVDLVLLCDPRGAPPFEDAGVPVVVHCETAGVDDIIRWLANGAADVLVGPLARRTLRGVLERLLGESERTQAVERCRGARSEPPGPSRERTVTDESPRRVAGEPFVQAPDTDRPASKPEPIPSEEVPVVLRRAAGVAEGKLIVGEQSIEVAMSAVQLRPRGLAVEIVALVHAALPLPGAKVVLWFPLPGGVHGFRSVVDRVAGHCLELAPPDRLVRYCRRRTPRYALAAVDRTVVTLPFADGTRWRDEGRVLDLSERGLALDLPARYEIAKGEQVRLGLGLSGAPVRDTLMVVRRIGPVVGDSRVVGMELLQQCDDGSAELRAMLAHLAERGARQLERFRVSDVPDLQAV